MVGYPVEYCLRASGTLTQGPNAGDYLDNVINGDTEATYQERGTLEAARKHAARCRALEPAISLPAKEAFSL